MTLRYFLPSYLSYKYHKRALSKTSDLAKIADHNNKIKQLREELFLHDAAHGNLTKLTTSKKHLINFFVTDNNGNNALHLAVMNNQRELVPFLLELGLKPKSRNFKDQSPISIASSLNYGGILYYLQEAESKQTNAIQIGPDDSNNKVQKQPLVTLYDIPILKRSP